MGRTIVWCFAIVTHFTNGPNTKRQYVTHVTRITRVACTPIGHLVTGARMWVNVTHRTKVTYPQRAVNQVVT